jgi:sarcosine oxidase
VSRGPRIVVVGAGAFGGWTALALVRRGARVTLLDAWAPGHVRASSGGETRVIRATYGSHAIYTEMAIRALALWREHDSRAGARLLRQTGALWMFQDDDPFGEASARTLESLGLPIERWTLPQAAARYPQIDFTGVRHVLFEPGAGYLMARQACAQVADCVIAEGGEYRRAAAAAPVTIDGGALRSVALQDGDTLEADAFVFACGPWLGQLFPGLLATTLSITKQDVYYFATPPGDPRFDDPALPVWLDFGTRQVYGIPGNSGRGFKIADDAPGPAFEPTSGSREITAEGVADARTVLARRFPALADAPLIGSEVCQYESTPDAHFILDRHPSCANVWIAGGGSGHGFKMGPVVGQLVADGVLADGPVEPAFSLGRFAAVPPGGWRPKWS